MAKKNARNTRGKIVSAAWKLFYEQGYEDTTVEEIIALSGTSKGSFYHYFDGKDALLSTLSSLFDEKYEELMEELTPDMTAMDQLLFLNQELFKMIEDSISLDLLAQHSFGAKGSYLPSVLTSFTQIGWFGVGVAMFAIPVAKLIAPENPWLPYLLVAIAGICMTGSAFFGIKAMTIVSYISVPLIAILGITAMVIAVKTGDVPLAEKFAENQGMSVIAGAGLVIGSFVSGGTATPNFARFSKTALQSVIVTVVAFFIGNSLMFCFGAFSGVYVGGNDIFEVMVALNLTVFAIIVLGLNIWTTNDNALYTAGLGLSNITKVRKRPMVVISGILGTVTAVWLYNNFVGWLNILNCTLPPVGMIVVLGYFCHKEEYEKWDVIPRQVNWFAIAGVLIGAAVANLVPWGIASVNGMVIAAVCYLVGELVERKKKK